jgi:glutamyl-tRNA reductase
LREKFEAIRNRELGKIFSLYPNLTEKEKQSLEAMTSAIINKILHGPLTLLKQTDEEAMADLYLDALRTLFQVSEKTLGESDTEKEKED